MDGFKVFEDGGRYGVFNGLGYGPIALGSNYEYWFTKADLHTALGMHGLVWRGNKIYTSNGMPCVAIVRE
jgi:hypothetical protein